MGVVNGVKRRVPLRLREIVQPSYPSAALPWVQGSFSQSGEDRIVTFLLGELRVPRPTYLDIGAYHPFHLSNTALLHLAGSRGVNVEPDPDSFQAFPRHRENDVNLNIGVGAEPGALTFYRMSTPTLSTFSKDAADHAVEESGGVHQILSTVDVEVRTPVDLLREVGVPDFLNLDAEGLDVDILRTMPLWAGLPAVVCVETITYSEHGHGVKVTEIGDLLTGMGYIAYADTYINTIFVLKDRWVGR